MRKASDNTVSNDNAMPRLTTFASLTAFLALVLTLVAAIFPAETFAQGGPPPAGIIYYGKATVGGEPAPDGHTIVGRVGDYESKPAIVSGGRYASLSVAADASLNGQTVTFFLGDVQADQTDTYQPHGIPVIKTGFDLTFSALSEPTAIPTNTPIQSQDSVDSDKLAKFVALMQYIRSTPTPADVKASNITLLATLDTALSDIYITGFITPYTGETPEQVKARLQSVPAEDRFTAVMVESYRLTSDPLLLDIIHQLLPLYYVEFFTTAEDLNASAEFLKSAKITNLAATFDSVDYAIPAPSVTGTTSPSTRGPSNVNSDDLAKFVAIMQYIRSTPTPTDVKSTNIPLLATLDNSLSDIYITGFITPYTGETPDQVKARLQSVSVDDRFIAVMVESYRLASNPLLLDIIHQLLPLYYVEFFTTAADLNASAEFLKSAKITNLAATFDSTDYAIPAPTGGQTPTTTPTATATPSTTPVATSTPTIAQLVRNVQGGVVQIITTSDSGTGFGTGFVIDSDGRVVTNEHVVRGYRDVTVRMFDGMEYQARVLGVDANADLALIDINGGENFQPVPLGDSSRVQLGEAVIAIGYPLLVHQLGQSMTVTDGVLSTRRPNFAQTGVEYLQHTATINPGNSGGPLFNRAGQVIGVNAARQLTNPGGSPVAGVYLAVAVNELKSRLENLKSGGNVPSPTPTPTATPSASPTPTTGWRWDRWEAGDGSWTISIPQGWTFNEDYSDETYSQFGDDELAIVDVSVTPNLLSREIFGLDAYARAVKSATESWGAENHPATFNVTSFEKKADRGGRKFYSLEYEYYFTSIGCWIYGIDHIFTDLDYGAVVSGSICDRDGIVSDEDWGDIPEILDSFELHHYTFVDIYRNNLYGHSLDLGVGYFLSEGSEEHDFSFFWGFEGSTRVAFLNIWTFEASEGHFYQLQDFARWRRERASAYATEQGWPLFQVRSLTKYSETSPIDGVTRQWYEFTYRRDNGKDCVEDVTELIILEDSKARGEIAYVVHGAVCEGHITKWGPRRDAALDSFRP